jgi:hypothetical protein
MDDITLLWILLVLSFLAAALRVRLAKAQGHPYRLPWSLQCFLFPVLLLAALVLYLSGIADLVFQLVMLGILEEIVCIPLRRKAQKQAA